MIAQPSLRDVALRIEEVSCGVICAPLMDADRDLVIALAIVNLQGGSRLLSQLHASYPPQPVSSGITSIGNKHQPKQHTRLNIILPRTLHPLKLHSGEVHHSYSTRRHGLATSTGMLGQEKMCLKLSLFLDPSLGCE